MKSRNPQLGIGRAGVFVGLVMCDIIVLYRTDIGGYMPRLRKDQLMTDKDRFTVLAPVEIIEALNQLADAKGMTRNALVVQVLAKATKAKKRKGE